MTAYIPQPVPVYEAQELQSFRRGNCQPYESRYVVNSDKIKMTNLMIRRPKSGAAATVYLVGMDDVDISTVTVTKTNFDLDPAAELEMLVLNAGDWRLPFSLASGLYYFRVETDATYYSECVYLEQTTEEYPQCAGDFAKITWTDGRCIVAGLTSDHTQEVFAYPDAEHTFFMYLRGNVASPEWELEEQGSNDAHGVFLSNFKRISKRWKFTGFPVNEATIDALQASSIFQTASIEFPSAQAFADIKDIKVAPQWEQGGCFTRFEYSFTSDYFIKRNCC